MSSTTRMPLAEAQVLAAELVALLQPACARLEVAGSIRRRKADVGDLELVAIPRFEPQLDMFGSPLEEPLNLLDHRVYDLLIGGALEARLPSAMGSRYKRLTYRNAPVDLFAVLAPAQWGVIFTIRTGPSDFSHRLVTPRRQGGLLPDWLRVQGGALRRVDDGEALATPEEADVFTALGLDWIRPEARR